MRIPLRYRPHRVLPFEANRPGSPDASVDGQLVSWMPAGTSFKGVESDASTARPVIAAVAPAHLDYLLDEGVLVDERAVTTVRNRLVTSSIENDDHPRCACLALTEVQYTVCRGGKSLGSIRHAHPVRLRYRIALTISRLGCLGGRPAGPTGGSGSRDSISFHCRSVGSEG